jgi:thiamine-monophosphate kinase
LDSEDKLIEKIVAAVPSEGRLPHLEARKHGLRRGIGDDAAIFHAVGNMDWVYTCDSFLEGVHFLPKTTPPDSVGYKSLARATSDLAAMGASPRFFFMTLAFPSSRTGRWLDGFLQGVGHAARELGLRLAGGDTTQFPLVSVSITVLGAIERNLAVPRSGAHPGDRIYVSGNLGGAQLGFELLRRGLGKSTRLRSLLQPHLYPQIRLELGSWLARHRIASSMMDISDGLSTDLSRLCRASQVGARVDAGRIPCVPIPESPALARLKLNPLQMALHGGDDYALLFTIPPAKRAQLRKAPGFKDLAEIGEIASEKRILLVDRTGRAKPLASRGWDPFRKSRRQKR